MLLSYLQDKAMRESLRVNGVSLFQAYHLLDVWVTYSLQFQVIVLISFPYSRDNNSTYFIGMSQGYIFKMYVKLLA